MKPRDVIYFCSGMALAGIVSNVNAGPISPLSIAAISAYALWVAYQENMLKWPRK